MSIRDILMKCFHIHLPTLKFPLPDSNLQLSTQGRDQYYSLLWIVVCFYCHIFLVLHCTLWFVLFCHSRKKQNTVE